MSKKESIILSITLALPAGRMSPELLDAVCEVVRRHNLSCYLTTMQNFRLMDVKQTDLETIKAELVSAGAVVKRPGMFPMPRVCAGRPYCKLAVADPAELSARIMERCGERFPVKPKLKLAIAGCPANCSNGVLADIGVVATKSGFDIYIGGKGGMHPRKGERIVRKADAEKVVEVIEKLFDFHDLKTVQKKRMYKLMQEPDFPFAVER